MMAPIDWHARAKKIDLKVNNFIDGGYVESANSDEKKIVKRSPRDGATLYEYISGSNDDMNHAVNKAKQSFEKGVWRDKSIHERKAVLQALADLVEKNTEEFALYECLDVGKPIANALAEDIPLTVATLRNTAEGADKLLSPSGTDGSNFAYQLRKPIGVVGSIIGWNYPLWMAAIKAAPALVMGNSLVLKPSEFTSLSACRFAELAVEAGVPPGVFNVVNGSGSTVGKTLAHHPDINLLSFTGSSTTGKQLMISAGQSNMKRLMLECGGKSPYIAFDDCPQDLDYIAADIVSSAFPNQGERCIAGTRLLIQEGLKERLLPKIIEQTSQLIPQDPLNPNTAFGALINEAHMKKVLAYIESGEKEGATLVYGGNRIQVAGCEQGYYIEPAIFDNVSPQQAIAKEEIFGPVLSVFTFKDEQEAIKLANDSCYGLAAFVATENLSRAHRLAASLDAGLICISGTSTPLGGDVDLSIEGHKQSGYGFEHGMSGLASYTISSAVNISF
ncbi:aldehyde dehydrogenase family protein [Porticoccaceae bacterium]|nr:aldehyde dehydrogenase family protein [Porticoccaceae bacterium]